MSLDGKKQRNNEMDCEKVCTQQYTTFALHPNTQREPSMLYGKFIKPMLHL